MLAGQQHRPLHPRVAQHLERRRQVVRDRRPYGLAAHGDAVEGVLLADQELLEQRQARPARGGSAPASCAARRRRRAGRSPARRRRRAAWRPAGTRPRRRKPAPRDGSVTSRCRAHGTPAARSTVFIRDLSRTLCAVSTSMPGMPSVSRTCASGTCSCSSAPTSRCTGPSWRRQPGDRLGDLPRVQRVVDPPVPGQVLRQLRRHPVGRRRGDQRQPDSGQLGRGGDEARGGREQERARQRRRRPCAGSYPPAA